MIMNGLTQPKGSSISSWDCRVLTATYENYAFIEVRVSDKDGVYLFVGEGDKKTIIKYKKDCGDVLAEIAHILYMGEIELRPHGIEISYRGIDGLPCILNN